MAKNSHCPLCFNKNIIIFLELGSVPLVNTLGDNIVKHPLYVHFCEACGLVFINNPRHPGDIFTNYTYFSSFSSTWLTHCKNLFHELEDNNFINKNSFIIEIASNDGYMLENFSHSGYKNILGIEPSYHASFESLKKGIPTINDFFTKSMAESMSSGQNADCIIALNVLAHVPDIINFLSGIKILLKADGFAVLEFHHLLSLIEKNQFDTIYHEHFSYLSLATVKSVLESMGLRLFCARKVVTHGGSLRIFISHKNEYAVKNYPTHSEIDLILLEENNYNLKSLSVMESFANSVKESIESSKRFILEIAASGKKIAGYGAAAKAVVFINNLGLECDTISCIADLNPIKHGSLIPGTSIPVVSPEEMIKASPDFVIIFPWNLKDEILIYLKEKLPMTTHYLVFNPEPEVFS